MRRRRGIRATCLDILLIKPDGALDRAREARNRAVNVAEDLEQAAPLERAAEQAGILEVIKRDGAVSFEAEVEEVEVLRDDRVRRAREVERERVLD